jgi:NAD(P)-dependent dehydrogenase (short-subunit alcohol dehydrogenase family)
VPGTESESRVSSAAGATAQAGTEAGAAREAEREAGAGHTVAVVTGGGTGIGRASALALARGGFSVVVAGRRPGPLEETVAEGTRGRLAITAYPADLTAAAGVSALFGHVERRFGRLDVLFNNAGRLAPPAELEDIPEADWRGVMDACVTTAFLCTQAAVRLMKKQRPRGGRIINNGSVSAHVPRPLSAPYTAAKHAVTGLTRSTSLDGRRFGIACSQIDIGNAATESAGWLSAGALQADGSLRPEPMMDVQIAAQAVAHIAGLPPEANVQFMTIMATAMPYIGRG